jgi:hypothetical protein
VSVVPAGFGAPPELEPPAALELEWDPPPHPASTTIALSAQTLARRFLFWIHRFILSEHTSLATNALSFRGDPASAHTDRIVVFR